MQRITHQDKFYPDGLTQLESLYATLQRPPLLVHDPSNIHPKDHQELTATAALVVQIKNLIQEVREPQSSKEALQDAVALRRHQALLTLAIQREEAQLRAIADSEEAEQYRLELEEEEAEEFRFFANQAQEDLAKREEARAKAIAESEEIEQYRLELEEEEAEELLFYSNQRQDTQRHFDALILP